MSIFEKFAKKYYEEAVKDLYRAERALEYSDFPQAVFYAQQCVEKCVKSLLEVKKRVVYNHGPELISIFIEAFERDWISEFNAVVEALEFLTEYYTRSRYPFLIKGEVFSPSEIVSREIALKGIELAKKALEVVKSYLARRNII